MFAYNYYPRFFKLFFAVLFLGICSIFMIHKGINNERGLIINGIIRFGVTGATYFYYIMGGISLILFLIAILGLFMGKRKLIVSNKYLLFPKMLVFSNEKVMNYKDIVSISEQVYKKNKILTLKSKNNFIRISPELFDSKEVYEDFKENITNKISECQNV